MQNLIIIPGLGDDARWTKFLTRKWEKQYDIKPHIITFGWKGERKDFPIRFEGMNSKVDNIIKTEDNVSILGISAGASAAINIFYPRRDKLKHAISVCGRLHESNIGRMWNHRTNNLGVFKESVELCEETITKFTPKDKERILTIRPIYDDVVPVRTMTIDGAVNKQVSAVQHMISIYLSMTLYSKTIADFIKN